MPSPNPAPVRDATPTRRGLMGVVAQTFSGMKTFLDVIKLASRTTGTLPVGGAELKGSIVYDSTTNRLQVHDGTGWVAVAMSTSLTDATTLEEHIASTSAHDSGSIVYTGGSISWADSTVFSPSNLDEAILDQLVAELAGPWGASKIGSAGESIQSRLDSLSYWKVDSPVLAEPDGAGMVGAQPLSYSGHDLNGATVGDQLAELLTFLTNKGGLNSANNWLQAQTMTGGITYPATITAPPTSTGWATLSVVVGYTKDALGFINWIGAVRCTNTSNAFDPIFSTPLPVGARPTEDKDFLVYASGTVVFVNITTAGIVTMSVVAGVANSNNTAANTKLELHQIRYRAA